MGPINGILRGGGRYVRLRALSLSLETLRVARELTQVYVALTLFLILLTASFFTLLTQALNRVLGLNLVTLTAALLGALSIGAILWTLREKRWLEATGMDEAIAELLAETHATTEEHGGAQPAAEATQDGNGLSTAPGLTASAGSAEADRQVSA